jgi:hypothetical protein
MLSKELGFEQDSLFWWNQTKFGHQLQRQEGYCYPDNISAYTVAELGEMLPEWFCSKKIDGNRGWVCFDEDNQVEDDMAYIEDCNTEADARGKMLIYLKENGLIQERG